MQLKDLTLCRKPALEAKQVPTTGVRIIGTYDSLSYLRSLLIYFYYLLRFIAPTAAKAKLEVYGFHVCGYASHE